MQFAPGVCLTLKAFGLKKLGIHDQLRLVWVATGSMRRRTGAGQRADRSFPQPAMAENSLHDVLLTASMKLMIFIVPPHLGHSSGEKRFLARYARPR